MTLVLAPLVGAAAVSTHLAAPPPEPLSGTAQQDHQNMKGQPGTNALRQGAIGNADRSNMTHFAGWAARLLARHS